MKNLKAQTAILAIIFVAVVSLAVGYFYLRDQNSKVESVNVGNYTKAIPDAKPKEVLEAGNPAETAAGLSPSA